MTVRRVRLGDVVHLVRRPVAVSASREYREIGVRSFGRGIFHKPTVTGAEIGAKRVFEIAPGDLVVSNVFAWEGAVAVAATSEEGRIGSHRFMTWVPSSGEVDVRYLLHYLSSDLGVAQLRKASPGSAGRNKTLSIKAFEDLRVPLPRFSTQQAVACRLDRVSGIRDALGGDQHGQLLTGALRQRVIDAVSATGKETELRAFLSPAADHITVEAGKAYPNVGVLNWGRGLFKKADVLGEETSYGRLYPIRAGQIIYSKLFAWEGSVTVVPPLYEGHFVSSEFPHFDVDGRLVEVRFLRHLLRTEQFVSQLRGAANGMGQRRQRVNPDRFLALTVRLPDLELQCVIADRLDALDQVDQLRDRRSTLVAALPQAARNEVFSKLV